MGEIPSTVQQEIFACRKSSRICKIRGKFPAREYLLLSRNCLTLKFTKFSCCEIFLLYSMYNYRGTPAPALKPEGAGKTIRLLRNHSTKLHAARLSIILGVHPLRLLMAVDLKAESRSQRWSSWDRHDWHSSRSAAVVMTRAWIVRNWTIVSNHDFKRLCTSRVP